MAAFTYGALSKRMDQFNVAFDAHKKKAYETRVVKRILSGAPVSATATVDCHIILSTIDRLSSQTSSLYHPRYTPAVWYDNGHRQDLPSVMHQGKWKARAKSRSSESMDEPDESDKAIKLPTAAKPELAQELEMSRKVILDHIAFEHPTVTLDLGTLRKNVAAAFEERD
ncbi:hypothetical protein BGZ98_001649 [Dissophora globulifera]|nr:hypothetical protein BGZ98_001649 [Dissophora globulifera]